MTKTNYPTPATCGHSPDGVSTCVDHDCPCAKGQWERDKAKKVEADADPVALQMVYPHQPEERPDDTVSRKAAIGAVCAERSGMVHIADMPYGTVTLEAACDAIRALPAVNTEGGRCAFPDGDLVSREPRPLESDELTMLDKHTQIGPCGQPRLVIDQQSFDLDNDGAKWKPERAQWYRRQMAIALARLLRKASALPAARQDKAEVERLRKDADHQCRERVKEWERANAAEAARDTLAEQYTTACRTIDQIAAERDALRGERMAADHALVDRYRDPKSGLFSFPDDVASIVRALDKTTAERDALRAQVEEMRADLGAERDNGDAMAEILCEVLSEFPGERIYIQPVLDTHDALRRAALSTPAAAAPQGWRPIETAPKDGSAIIVWNDSAGSSETCPLCFNWNGVEPERGRLCLYHAHGEGLSYGADGLNVAVWGGGWCDSWEDGGGSLPDWWFRADSEFDVAINPTHWMPLPEPPALPLPNADKGEV